MGERGISGMKIKAVTAWLAISVPIFSAAAQNKAPAPTPPMMRTTIHNDDYPKDAIGENADGVSQVEVDLDSRGHMVRCRTSGRSGSPPLDVATCQLLKREATFVPALDADGVAVPSEVPIDFIWRIPGHPYPNRRPVDALVTVKRLPLGVRNPIVRVAQIQRADGSFESCSVIGSSRFADVDAVACSTANSAQLPPLIEHGQPVRGLRIQQIAFVPATLATVAGSPK